MAEVTPFDYPASRKDADDLIQEFGRVASLRRMTDSGTEWEPTRTATDFATYAAKVDFTSKQIDTGNVLATDERWLVAAGPLDVLGVSSIATPDILLVGTVEKPVLLVETTDPAGIVVLFDCHIRV